MYIYHYSAKKVDVLKTLEHQKVISDEDKKKAKEELAKLYEADEPKTKVSKEEFKIVLPNSANW